MDTFALMRHFNRMGARLKVRDFTGRQEEVRLNVLRDRMGEYFDLAVHGSVDLSVLNIVPSNRHLLLRAESVSGDLNFLCGHDERHWFAAGVSSRVRTVSEAKDSLKPAIVHQELIRKKVRKRKHNSRKNEAFKRQGEWFFIPVPNVALDESLCLHNEPIQRARSKPHIVEFLLRTGGETVRVHDSLYPNGLLERQYQSLSPTLRRKRGWRVMRRNAAVYAKGKVRHPDHKTLVLRCWHRVVLSNERSGMSSLAFLD